MNSGSSTVCRSRAAGLTSRRSATALYASLRVWLGISAVFIHLCEMHQGFSDSLRFAERDDGEWRFAPRQPLPDGPGSFRVMRVASAQDEQMLGGFDRNDEIDRKSTRLNSSHLGISYAVFCL